jgi:hypothetical protein
MHLPDQYDAEDSLGGLHERPRGGVALPARDPDLMARHRTALALRQRQRARNVPGRRGQGPSAREELSWEP